MRARVLGALGLVLIAHAAPAAELSWETLADGIQIPCDGQVHLVTADPWRNTEVDNGVPVNRGIKSTKLVVNAFGIHGPTYLWTYIVGRVGAGIGDAYFDRSGFQIFPWSAPAGDWVSMPYGTYTIINGVCSGGGYFDVLLLAHYVQLP